MFSARFNLYGSDGNPGKAGRTEPPESTVVPSITACVPGSAPPKSHLIVGLGRVSSKRGREGDGLLDRLFGGI